MPLTKTDRFSSHRAAPLVIGLVCVVLVCAMLTAGLWPFHAPINQVSWSKDENSLRFGDHGTAITSGSFAFSPSAGSAFTLELSESPAKLWSRGTVLSFYDSASGQQFSVEQDYADLVLHLGTEEHPDGSRQTRMRIADVFRRPQAFITITSDGRSTSVYLDGVLAKQSSSFGLSLSDLSGRLILANSPLQSSSWSGRLNAIALYGEEFSAPEVEQHFTDWRQKPPPRSAAVQPLALYLFDERAGNVVHNRANPEANLEIPRRFRVVDQIFFESPAMERRTQHNFVKNILINIAGFVPLGFCLGLYFAASGRMRNATLVTVLIGAAVSLTIEVLQAFLPTRYSGVTDLITNTTGTWLGLMLYRASTRLPLFRSFSATPEVRSLR